MSTSELTIRPATPADVPAIFGMIFELAVFEKLEHMVVANEAMLHESLFCDKPVCEALVGETGGEVVTFALFFHNFATFLCKKGLYLEDLYVKQSCRGKGYGKQMLVALARQQSCRGKGYGKQMLVALARLAVERDCGRFEWSVLDWNANAISFYEGMGATVMPDWRICRVTGDALSQLSAQA